MRLYLIRHGATAGNLQGRYIGRTEEPLCEEGREHLVRQWTSPPPIRALYISPSLRCRQTASLLFPQKIPVEVEDLRECDFGLFEGKNYQELAGNPLYQAWIDSGGSLPFPGGESPEEVRERTLKGFYGVLRREEERREKEKRERELGEGKKEEEKKEKEEGKEEEETKEKGIGIEEEDKKEKGKGKEEKKEKREAKEDSIAIIAHGGTFMHLLSVLGEEEKGFYDWHLGNGEGYVAELSQRDEESLLQTKPQKRTPMLPVVGKIGQM